ncbi:MAG: transketolase [bacterium]
MDNKLFIERVYSVKKRFLTMYQTAHAGHIACSLSCADILTFLHFDWMDEPNSLILSKGHAAAALYSVLAERGLLSESEIQTFYQNGTYLGAHPPANRIKGIPFATGSLGHGLSISAGRALASKLKKENQLFFCVTSDGELDEGSIWEAALFIVQHQLNNLIWLIDRNNLQGFGRTENVMALEPLSAKLVAFNFNVIEADGHNYESLLSAKKSCLKNKPNVIICKTIKGKGVSFMEDKLDWHYLPMNEQQFKQAMSELDAWRNNNAQ